MHILGVAGGMRNGTRKGQARKWADSAYWASRMLDECKADLAARRRIRHPTVAQHLARAKWSPYGEAHRERQSQNKEALR